MRKLFLLFYILFPLLSFSQISIDTTNPQGVFHIDGGKDNPSTGIPSATQQSNDFLVSSLGNVGIGMTTPQRKLDIDAMNESLRISNLIRQVPTDFDILLRDASTGDITRQKYSYSVNSTSIQSGATGTITIPTGINIPNGMMILRAGNACGRTMISIFVQSDMALGYLNSVARDKVGTATYSAAAPGSSAGWEVKFTNVTGCGDGGNGTQFDYTLVKTAANVYTITNNGNVARTYTLTIFRL